MSNLLWIRVLLGSGLLGLLGAVSISPIAAANDIAPVSDRAGRDASSLMAFEVEGLDDTAPTVSDIVGNPYSPTKRTKRRAPLVQRSTPTDDMGQVTSVSQLSDVDPTDWAYQALQSLVERYGCIAGYPDGTFRGNRKATRYELAAALNACLDQISDRFATKEDLAAVKALQEEFAAELAVLKGRVDGLEARVDTIEAQQFSTTTKLNGEAIMAFSFLGGDNVNTGNPIEDDANPTINQRTRLNLLTSFTGKDRLYTRLQSSNRPVNFSGAGFPAPFGVSGTLDTRVAFDTGNTNNNFILDRLDYKFPIGDKFAVTAFANAAFHHYYATTINPYFEGFGGGKGAISFFGERNPIYRIGTVAIPGVAGIGTTYNVNDKIRIDLGYLAGRANQATETFNPNGEGDGGLFGGTFSLLGQVSFKPTEKTQIGLTYLRNNAPDGNIRYGVGSRNANLPFTVGGVAQALSADSFGLEGSFTITDRFAIGGWVGYTIANQANSTNDADIINGAINFAFPDLGKEGAVGGLIVGVPPQTIDNDIAANEDPGTTIHLEALYQFPVNDNIAVTPGIIYLINPEANDSNGDIVVGVVRTTFKF